MGRTRVWKCPTCIQLDYIVPNLKQPGKAYCAEHQSQSVRYRQLEDYARQLDKEFHSANWERVFDIRNNLLGEDDPLREYLDREPMGPPKE